jgi:hypothetical protein
VNKPTCRPHDAAIPDDVARYHGRDELAPIGATVRWSVPFIGAGPYEGEVIGFERRYGTTRVKVLMHATTCPEGCTESRLRTYEGAIIPAPVSVRIVA